ncbi:uncharacterized protein LOC126885177 [Diabrotica virgifera virgifera]|uniref:Uncharacterized protein n=1 Tax=Diabrotica virgifera virgifera TaxID=50390 RepID=A0ABM5KBJ6_DIAVI|nr:uncharacterized protein LOC126885177 [Diabrotica virgifera virgifera]
MTFIYFLFYFVPLMAFVYDNDQEVTLQPSLLKTAEVSDGRTHVPRAQKEHEYIMRTVVKIINVETQLPVGVDTSYNSLSVNSRYNRVYAKKGLQHDKWILVPDCDGTNSSRSYRIFLADVPRLALDRAAGCASGPDKDAGLLVYEHYGDHRYPFNNHIFHYDPYYKLLMVCDYKCIIVDPTDNNRLTATNWKNCLKNNRKFEILFQEFKKYNLPKPTKTCIW